MKDNRKKVIMYTTLGIIALGIVALTITYAYWRLTREQTKHNEISTGCFNIEFTGENDITLDKAYPMKPEELENFLSSATPYHFTIENTCDDLATATINLESLNSGVEKQLNDEYIDAILYEIDYHNNLNSVKQLIASIYNDENKVLEDSLHAYKLYNFTLQKGEAKSFNLQLYMDSNTPMETANMNASWKGKITLSAEYKEEKFANLGGKKVPVIETGDGLYEVKHDDLEELGSEWNKTEYRYAGANPNNYVEFNNEIWRIIGLVNVKVGNSVEQRLKIVRTDGVKEQKTFGNYAWDRPSGYTNNWTTSKLKDMLNGIYYESSTGECYTGNSGRTASENTCDFNVGTELPKGLDDTTREMIDKEVIWNIGGSSTVNGVTVKMFYERERGTSTGNDNTYPNEWSSETDVGEKYNGIGLIYPSDYGYATNGGSIGRETCFAQYLYNWDNKSGNYKSECGGTDWLKPTSGYLWTQSPNSSYSGSAFYVDSSGSVNSYDVYNAFGVWAVGYLKSSVKITSNPNPEQDYGTVDNPFVLSM